MKRGLLFAIAAPEHLAEFPPSDPEDLASMHRRGGETTSIDRRVGPNAWPAAGLPRASGSTICGT